MSNKNPWFILASEDYQTIKELCGKNLHRSILFHVQQFFEKIFKGLMYDRGMSPPKTHDLILLVKALNIKLKDLDLNNSDLQFLNSVYIETRYPPDLGLLPGGEPTEKDEKDAISLTDKLYEKMKSKLVLNNLSCD